MRKKYIVMTIRIERTRHNLQVLNMFNTWATKSNKTKGDWFVYVIYKYFLMKQESKLSFFKKLIILIKK